MRLFKVFICYALKIFILLNGALENVDSSALLPFRGGDLSWRDGHSLKALPKPLERASAELSVTQGCSQCRTPPGCIAYKPASSSHRMVRLSGSANVKRSWISHRAAPPCRTESPKVTGNWMTQSNVVTSKAAPFKSPLTSQMAVCRFNITQVKLPVRREAIGANLLGTPLTCVIVAACLSGPGPLMSYKRERDVALVGYPPECFSIVPDSIWILNWWLIAWQVHYSSSVTISGVNHSSKRICFCDNARANPLRSVQLLHVTPQLLGRSPSSCYTAAVSATIVHGQNVSRTARSPLNVTAPCRAAPGRRMPSLDDDARSSWRGAPISTTLRLQVNPPSYLSPRRAEAYGGRCRPLWRRLSRWWSHSVRCAAVGRGLGDASGGQVGCPDRHPRPRTISAAERAARSLSIRTEQALMIVVEAAFDSRTNVLLVL